MIMSNYRTSTLFHFTKSFANIKSIVTNGLQLSYCSEVHEFPKNTEYEIGIPMVSFCDIPILRCDEMSKRYGKYAIGLSKEWGLANSINPILYIQNNVELSDALHRILSIEHSLRIKHQRILDNNYGNVDATGISKVKFPDGKEIDETAETVDAYYLRYESNVIRNLFFPYSKAYNVKHKGKPICAYEENEWRYVIPYWRNEIKWFWGKEECDKYLSDKSKLPVLPKLRFKVDDVNFVLVKNEKEILKMVKLIKSNKFLFSGNPITENERGVLLTKIISFERIKNNY